MSSRWADPLINIQGTIHKLLLCAPFPTDEMSCSCSSVEESFAQHSPGRRGLFRVLRTDGVHHLLVLRQYRVPELLGPAWVASHHVEHARKRK